MSIELAQRADVREVLLDVDALEQRMREYAVVTVDQFLAGAADLARVKAAQKKLESTRVGITGPMNQALKAALDLFRSPGDRLARIEAKIKHELAAYDRRQQEIARQEQAAAEEKARKEQERLEARAQLAAAAGKVEKAEELQERAAAVVAPVISRAAPKVAGLASRKNWKFEVTDPALVPREYLCVDEVKVRGYVNAMRESARIPGVRIYSEDSYAARAATPA